MTEAKRPQLYGVLALAALALAGALLLQAVSVSAELDRARRRGLDELDAANDELRARVRELQRQTGRTDFENVQREPRPDVKPETKPADEEETS